MTVTSHLPECCMNMTDAPPDGHCICDRISACEQRSYTLGIEVGKHDGWVAGHAAGLAAAREAVLGVSVYRWPYSEPSDEYTECITVDSALAAIDALRKEQK